MSGTAEHPVRRLRLHLGDGVQKWTQREFAEEIDTHPTYVSQVETGTQQLGSEVALRIADRFPREMARLGLTVEDLLRGARTPLGNTDGAAA